MKLKHSYLFRTLLTFLLFACVSVNAHAESVTYAQSSKSETVALSKPNGAKVQFSTTYTNTYQLTAGHSMTYTFSGFDGCTITGITIKMRSNQDKGSGYIEIKVGNDEKYKEIGKSINGINITNKKVSTFKDWYGSYHNDAANYANIVPDITSTEVGKDENLVITIGATVNSLYCQSVTIDYEMPNGYVKSPTLPTSCSFMEPMNVKITNNTDGATIYYTTDKSEPSANKGTIYSEPFTITETTTVKAIAVKGNAVSGIAEATYTKIEDYYQVSFSVNGAIDAENDILIPYGESLVESSLPAVGHPENIKMKGWAREDNSTEIVTFPITNIKEDLILYAVFELVGCFELVTDISALTEGDRVVIACPEYSKVISTADMIINGASCAVSTIVEFKDNALLPTDDSRVFVLHKNSDGYFMFENNGEFLVCPEDDNRLSMQKTPQEKMHMWAVTITDGTAIIKNKKYSREIKYNLSAPRFACYVSGQKPVSIYKEITPTTVSTTYTPLQISAAGYSTMYLDKDVTIPTTVEAYLATEVGNGYIVMTQYRGVLPRETGIILRGHEGKYAFMHSTTTTVVESLLKGTLSNEYVSGGGYVLSIQNGEIGFYKAQEKENGTFLNNANKAYLPASAVPASLQSNGLRFKIDDTVNIEYQDTILNYDCQSTIIYDLMGRRLEHMTKGIYIVNGRKIIIP